MEHRAERLAQYIIENRTTVRAAAQKFGISKSTVHMDATKQNGPRFKSEAGTVFPFRVRQFRYSLGIRSPQFACFGPAKSRPNSRVGHVRGLTEIRKKTSDDRKGQEIVAQLWVR